MKMCNGCVYNLNKGTDPNSALFKRYGCGQDVCVHEARMFDFDTNYKPKQCSVKKKTNKEKFYVKRRIIFRSFKQENK